MVALARGIAVLVVALAAVSATAQVTPITPTTGLGQPTTQSMRLPERSTAAIGTLALEGTVDPNAYLVGPGDVFTIAIGGMTPRQYTATVAADGRLVVPEAGSFAVGGRTLARARSDVQSTLQQRYQNVTADLSLTLPRTFYVHVSGRVSEPGRHLMPAVARVEDAIVESTSSQIYTLARYGEQVDDSELRWPALRNVRITHRSGGTETVDLMRYFTTGDLNANPYLQDGDAIHLPAFDPLVEGVVVDGAVDRPGTYDVRPGDTALTLIVATSGTDTGNRIERVRRVRPGTGRTSETTEVSFADAGRLDVQARDQIYAVASRPEADRAEVLGAVRYPGIYPIVDGETTLDELVEMAGGLRPEALVRGTYLERPLRESTARTLSQAQPGSDDTIAPDVTVESDLLGGLFGRQFFTRQTERTPRVSITPEQAIDGRQQVQIRGGDRLVVPADLGLVRVYGRVLRGGYVPYVEGATASDYVVQAGGTGPTASDIYVVDAASGQLIQGPETPVRPGDAVFVNSLPSPDTPEFAQLALQERQDAREDARDRRQTRFQFVQTLVSVVGTVASLIIAYSAITSSN